MENGKLMRYISLIFYKVTLPEDRPSVWSVSLLIVVCSVSPSRPSVVATPWYAPQPAGPASPAVPHESSAAG